MLRCGLLARRLPVSRVGLSTTSRAPAFLSIPRPNVAAALLANAGHLHTRPRVQSALVARRLLHDQKGQQQQQHNKEQQHNKGQEGAGQAGGKQSEGFWRWLLSLGPRYPFAVGVGVATVKTGVADVVVQYYIEDKKELDQTRLWVFTAFGFAYLGIFQYALYVMLFRRLFGNAEKFGNLPFREKIRNREGLKDLAKQVVVDNFIHAPFIFFPCYYIMKESIQGEPNLFTAPFGEVARNALGHYRTNGVQDLIAMWKIWILGDAFVFALPLWARLPANHVISFVYVCILSFTRGRAIRSDKSEDVEGSASS